MNFRLHCFGDDTQLYYSFRHNDNQRAFINKDLHEYATQHNLTLNYTKTKVILLWVEKKQTLLESSLDLHLNNEPITNIPDVLRILIESLMKIRDFMKILLNSMVIVSKQATFQIPNEKNFFARV